MARTVVLRSKEKTANYGNSDYLLISSTIKEFLARDLGEAFDRSKHQVVVELSVNGKGQLFAAFWFEKTV